MAVTPAPIVTDFKEVHLVNAYSLTVVEPLPGMFSVVRAVAEKAYSPIVVTLSGMTTDARLPQPEKHVRPIVVTPSGILTAVNDLHASKQ